MKARYFAGLILAYLLFLVVTAPAAWLAPVLTRMSGGEVILASPSGHVWHGGGTLYVRPISDPVLVGPIRWKLFPAALLLGRVRLELHINGGINGRAVVERSWSRWSVRGVKLSCDAQSLVPLIPELALFTPEGTVDFDARALVLTPNAMTGAGMLTWRQAALGISDVRPLGSYQLRMDGAGTRATWQITSLNGPLNVEGAGEWRPQGEIEGILNVSISGPNPALEHLLSFAGRQGSADRKTLPVSVQGPAWRQLF